MDLLQFEALKLDETDFIVDPNAQNVCFFPLPIFTRISEMLSPSDFVHLAQTCRYMHWRMFKYGHLMLKHHVIQIDHYGEEIEGVRFEGRRHKYGEMILPRPYVYFEYLHLNFEICDYSPWIFHKMIDYVNEAKKRIKHYCIRIMCSMQCTLEGFQEISNLIERFNPLHLFLYLSWDDYKLTVEIPNIKNIYSVYLYNLGVFQETECYMNPCAEYIVYTVQDLCDIVQEFTMNSRLQFHVCHVLCFPLSTTDYCEMLEKEWTLKFKEIDEALKNHFCFSESYGLPLYASIPSQHGNVEIFISNGKFVIQRKETVIGQWKDFYRNVNPF